MVVQSERYDAQRPPCDPVLRQLLRISDKLKSPAADALMLALGPIGHAHRPGICQSEGKHFDQKALPFDDR